MIQKRGGMGRYLYFWNRIKSGAYYARASGKGREGDEEKKRARRIRNFHQGP